MNIWIVNQYAITPSQAGPTRHYDFAVELVRRGHSVTIVTSSFDHFTHAESRLSKDEVYRLECVEGIEFLWLRSIPYKTNGLARIINMAHFACSVWWRKSIYRGKRPDVIMGSSPTLFAAFASERLARRYNVPFVLEVRDIWPQTLVDFGGLSASHPIVKALEIVEKYLYRQAAQIVSLLPNASRHMVARGASEDSVSWVPNGVRLEAIDRSTELDPNDPFVALYAGAHGTANSLDTILDAAARLRLDGWEDRIRFLLIGDGPQKKRLIARVKAENLTSVEFIDQVPRSRILSFVSLASVLLMPMRSAAVYTLGISPNKLYHYMATARPIVFASSSSNNPVSEAQCGFTVPPEDARALAETLKTAAALSPIELLQMGIRGRVFVERHHNIEALAGKLEAVFLSSGDSNTLQVDAVSSAR